MTLFLIIYIFTWGLVGGFDFLDLNILFDNLLIEFFSFYTDTFMDNMIKLIDFTDYNTFIKSVNDSPLNIILSNNVTENKQLYWDLQININNYLQAKGLPPKYDIINKIL